MRDYGMTRGPEEIHAYLKTPREQLVSLRRFAG
jgi:hypothetical protein